MESRSRSVLDTPHTRGTTALCGAAPSTSLRANGSRECAPDDRLREAIHTFFGEEQLVGLDLFRPPRQTTQSRPGGLGCHPVPARRQLCFIDHCALNVSILPLPRHCVQRAGKILRPGCRGCVTAGNPVPSHAGQSTSVPASFGLGRFINSFLWNEENHFHIVM
jgi:hypothetical protein